MKFYSVIRPSMDGTQIPVYYYTFAENETEAQTKIEMNWGCLDKKTRVKEITGEDLKELVIATDYFG